jgi:hypothetical protein
MLNIVSVRISFRLPDSVRKLANLFLGFDLHAPHYLVLVKFDLKNELERVGALAPLPCHRIILVLLINPILAHLEPEHLRV